METSIEVVTPASSYDLISLAEVKVALEIDPSNTGSDAMLQGMITRSSGYIAALCARVFGQETVIETFEGIVGKRLYLSRYPVLAEDIESVIDGGEVEITDYLVDEESGKLTRSDGWSQPVTVTYKGGYALPDEAPEALKQAAMLQLQDRVGSGGSVRDAGIRMISHKDSRVMYYQAGSSSGGSSSSSSGGGGTASARAIETLTRRYWRLWA